MICRQGPLDGVDIPKTGRAFFIFITYDTSEGSRQIAHVYGDVDDEWHYQPDATQQATCGANEERKD
jgi:hypothetical protein